MAYGVKRLFKVNKDGNVYFAIVTGVENSHDHGRGPASIQLKAIFEDRNTIKKGTRLT